MQAVRAAARAVAAAVAADNMLSAEAVSEQVLRIMHCSLWAIRMYMAEPALQTEQTAQDLQWVYTETSAYHCLTLRVLSAPWVTESEALRRHSLVILYVTQDTLVFTSAEDRLFTHRLRRRVSRFRMHHIVTSLQFEEYSKKIIGTGSKEPVLLFMSDLIANKLPDMV